VGREGEGVGAKARGGIDWAWAGQEISGAWGAVPRESCCSNPGEEILLWNRGLKQGALAGGQES